MYISKCLPACLRSKPSPAASLAVLYLCLYVFLVYLCILFQTMSPISCGCMSTSGDVSVFLSVLVFVSTISRGISCGSICLSACLPDLAASSFQTILLISCGSISVSVSSWSVFVLCPKLSLLSFAGLYLCPYVCLVRLCPRSKPSSPSLCGCLLRPSVGVSVFLSVFGFVPNCLPHFLRFSTSMECLPGLRCHAVYVCLCCLLVCLRLRRSI